MDKRDSESFYACDLMSDILSRGKSSRLYDQLVREKKLFSEINAFITGDLDEGLFVVSGKLNEGVKMEDAETGVELALDELRTTLIPENELEKVKNKVETTKAFNDMSVLDKAMELCYFELLGDANRVNHEIDRYKKVTAADILKVAQSILRKENSSTLYYYPNH